MCSPRQLFFFQCGPAMPKGWTPLDRMMFQPTEPHGQGLDPFNATYEDLEISETVFSSLSRTQFLAVNND